MPFQQNPCAKGNCIAIAEILSAHGLHGEVKLRSLSGEYDHIRSLTQVTVLLDIPSGTSELRTISLLRGQGKQCIVQFIGVSTREDALALRGAIVRVDRKFASPLKDGEYYYADLLGLDVVFENKVFGKVVSLWENGNCDMFEVRLNNGKISQLPFIKHFIEGVHIQSRTIRLSNNWILEWT